MRFATRAGTVALHTSASILPILDCSRRPLQLKEFFYVDDAEFDVFGDGGGAGEGVALGLAGEGFHFDAEGGDDVAVAVVDGEGDDDASFNFAVEGEVHLEDFLFDVGSGLAELRIVGGGHDAEMVLGRFAVDTEGLDARIFLLDVAEDGFDERFARGVGDAGVGEVADGIAFGPETDFAGSEAVVSEFGDDGLAVEEDTDFVGLTFDGEIVPGAGGDLHFGSDGGAALAIDQFEEAEGAAFGAGANVVIIFFVLVAEDDAGHLFDDAGDALEARGESEIAEGIVRVDEDGVMLVGEVARELGEDRFFGRGGVGGDGWNGGGDFVCDDAPEAGFAFAGDGAVKAGEGV